MDHLFVDDWVAILHGYLKWPEGIAASKQTKYIWLVVKQPLWKIWASHFDGIPNIWKAKIHGPNHQPDI